MELTRSRTTRFLHETVHFLLGVMALAALTAVCFWLDFPLISAASAYLILIVVLSLTGSFLAPLVLSFMAVACLAYFFAPPIFDFRMQYPQDIITTAAFLITSLVVTGLVRRMRAAKDELANVIDAIPALVWDTSPDGAAEFSNQRLRDYTGFSSDELRGWGWINALHPDDRRVEKWGAAFAAGERFENEVRIRSANGDYRWFALRMMPMRDERGAILKWYGTASDVEERKRTEQALRRSEAYLAEAQRISQTGSFAYDVASRRLIYSSEEHHRLFGFDPAAPMPAPKDWAQRIHPDDRERAIERMEQTLRERTDYAVDFRIVHPDGTIKHIHSVSHAVLSPSGDLVEIVGTSTDVTERKQAEYLIGQVFERSPDLVAILGRDYRYRRANPTFEKFWGIAPEKVIGMHLRDLIGEDMFDRLAKPNLDRCLAGEETSYAEWFNAPGGHKYWFVTYSPLRLESEQAEAVLIVARDLTERMLASEKLRNSQTQLAHANRVATVGELTASIAHEVNQPIGALVTNAHAALRMLRAHPLNLDQASEALADIIKDGRRVSEVIDRIRALVKKAPARADRLDLNKAIMDSIALTRGEILSSGVSLGTQLARDLPPIRGDRVQLQQVIMNLVMNAIEAMSGVDDGRRELQIATGKDGEDQILVTVRDSGPTLKPESLERFFEAFYSTKQTGMGIGLSICRSIVEAHGGRIWAIANVPRGATLHIALPASQNAASQ